MRGRIAFTLIELLVVIGIIGVLAGILFPVYALARKSARTATTISNLRQCGLALRLYCDDYGGDTAMPSGAAAREVLKHAPTCDPSDTWRSGCVQQLEYPMIGSYGYIRGLKFMSDDEDWDAALKNSRNPTLLVSIFTASNVPIVCHGEALHYTIACGPDASRCGIPDKVMQLKLDGSVHVAFHAVVLPNGNRFLFSWPQVFSY